MLDHCQRGVSRAAELLRLVARRCPFGNRVKRRFRPFDLLHRRDVFRGVERAFHHGAPHADQFAQQGKVVNLFGQFARGQQTLSIGGQARQIGDAAQFLQRRI